MSDNISLTSLALGNHHDLKHQEDRSPVGDQAHESADNHLRSVHTVLPKSKPRALSPALILR